MSLPQALKKVEELQDKERRVKISSRKQVIDHMRKHKQVSCILVYPKRRLLIFLMSTIGTHAGKRLA